MPLLKPNHVLSSVFLSLGGWALLAPEHVIRTVMKEPEVTETTKLLMACFGAQAVMNGILFATVRMTPTAYKVFAGGMVPFFCWNYYHSVVRPVINGWMWLDVAGSAAIVGTCLWGLKADEDAGKKKGE